MGDEMHTSAETELEYTNLRKSWASPTDVVPLITGYWEICVVTYLGGGFQICFNFHPDPWGNDPIWRAWFFGWELDMLVLRTRNAIRLPAISRLLLCCNPRGAGERRKCVTCPFFSWNANGEWTEVIADPPKKRKRDSFVLFFNE